MIILFFMVNLPLILINSTMKSMENFHQSNNTLFFSLQFYIINFAKKNEVDGARKQGAQRERLAQAKNHNSNQLGSILPSTNLSTSPGHPQSQASEFRISP
jgi:CRISPR/Cas system CMR-associated protein Cmr5 small subunit